MINVNHAKLQNLMQAFQALTGLRITLFDNECQEITAWPPEHGAFCQCMRANPQFLQKCIQSDREAFRRSAKEEGPYVYTCHAGLSEAVIQLRDDSLVIGYIMFGQVVPEETSRQTRVHLSQLCIENNEVDLLESIFSMPGKTSVQIHAAAAILEALSVYLWSDKVIMLPRKNFMEMLDAYIDEHAAQRITVDELCVHFGVGRTYLYRLASRYLECGIADYIKSRRIKMAQRLLCQGNLPIAAIAGAVGFSEYNYFSKCFRRQTGLSARQWREQHTAGRLARADLP